MSCRRCDPSSRAASYGSTWYAGRAAGAASVPAQSAPSTGYATIAAAPACWSAAAVALRSVQVPPTTAIAPTHRGRIERGDRARVHEPVRPVDPSARRKRTQEDRLRPRERDLSSRLGKHPVQRRVDAAGAGARERLGKEAVERAGEREVREAGLPVPVNAHDLSVGERGSAGDDIERPRRRLVEHDRRVRTHAQGRLVREDAFRGAIRGEPEREPAGAVRARRDTEGRRLRSAPLERPLLEESVVEADETDEVRRPPRAGTRPQHRP